MFAVLFEVHPKKEHWDTYLGVGKMLRPEIERIDGFIDNIRYRSLTREGWIFSLSGWRDEKALVRWRTQSRHHDAQDRGRTRDLERLPSARRRRSRMTRACPRARRCATSGWTRPKPAARRRSR